MTKIYKKMITNPSSIKGYISNRVSEVFFVTDDTLAHR